MSAKILRYKNNAPYIALRADYNVACVQALRESGLWNEWDGIKKIRKFLASDEQAVRAIVRQFMPIEGENDVVERETLTLRVVAGNSAKRSYRGGVTIDGQDVVNMLYGSLNRNASTFCVKEVISEKWLNGDPRHAFDVEYVVKVELRKGATIETYGNANHYGVCEVLNV